VSLQFARLGVLSPDGRCKSFDEAANGYCRSEAVVVLLLQKLKNSRRVYCRLVHAKTNCDGYKEQGITYPSGQMQQRLLEEFYEECEVEPNDLSFIEAHGTGTKVRIDWQAPLSFSHTIVDLQQCFFFVLGRRSGRSESVGNCILP
jgi:fatty acid synthase